MGLTNPPYYQRNCILKTSMATVYGNRNDQEQSHIKKSRITGSKKAGYPFSSRSMTVSAAQKTCSAPVYSPHCKTRSRFLFNCIRGSHPFGKSSRPNRSSASLAACCSDSFLVRPLPVPYSSPFIKTPEVKIRLCSGPSNRNISYTIA